MARGFKLVAALVDAKRPNVTTLGGALCERAENVDLRDGFRCEQQIVDSPGNALR